MSDHPFLPVIEELVFDEPSGEGQFNPYLDEDVEHDRPGAASIRRENLRNYLNAAPDDPEFLLLAEAPGPHGCRFSGVPFTSESQLVSGSLPFGGRATSIDETPKREYSARIVWETLMPHFDRFLIWNTVPFHPHKRGRPLTIRTPRVAEIRYWSDLLIELTRVVAPRTILAVGRIAERACHEQEVDCSYVRHPSQGGANIFRSTITDLLASG